MSCWILWIITSNNAAQGWSCNHKYESIAISLSIVNWLIYLLFSGLYFQTLTMFSVVFYLEMRMTAFAKKVEHVVHIVLKHGGIPLQSVWDSKHSFLWREVSGLYFWFVYCGLLIPTPPPLLWSTVAAVAAFSPCDLRNMKPHFR